MDKIILLNADFTFLNFIDLIRTIKLMIKNKVEVIKQTSNKIYKNFENSFIFKIPSVVKLVEYVKLKYKREVTFTKQNIFIRDNYSCCYCNKKLTSKTDKRDKKPTVDHIVSKFEGGKSSWNNCVTACIKCNSKKGNKSLKKSKMNLKKKPYKPTVDQFMKIKGKLSGLDKLIEEVYS